MAGGYEGVDATVGLKFNHGGESAGRKKAPHDPDVTRKYHTTHIN